MKTQTGFTLVELMIVLALAAILLTVGVPSFSNMIQNNRIVTQTNGFVSSLHLARSEAVKRGIPVAICPTSDPTATNPTCVDTTDWSKGWLVFTDDSGTAGVYDNTDVLLQIHEGPSDGITLTGNSPSVRRIRFDARGALTPSTALALTLAPQTCPAGDSHVRAITVTAPGQVRIATNNCP